MAQGQGEYIIKIGLDKGQVTAEINGIKVALNDLDKSFNKNTSATKKNVKANQDLISSSGLAGATLVETGRFISDLPFGITAVTNNLSQLSTLFITLASKTEESGGAFKALGKQLKGPLGFILIFQVVISLIQVYQKEILGFIKGTKGANEATKELTKSVDDLSEKLKENNKDFKDREKAEKILNKLRDTALEYENRSLQAQKGIESAQNARITSLKELGIEVDKNRILEEGYIDTLLTGVKTSKEVSKELEKRRIDIIVAGILGTMTPLELAQAQLDLFIDTQKELSVLEEAYLESEEYRTLVAKRDSLRQRTQIEAFESNLTPEGLAPIGDAELKAEVRLTKFVDGEAVKRAFNRREAIKILLIEIEQVLSTLEEVSNTAFEAEISREERKTALMNNQLKERLRNEKLSAKQRENINSQIQANEESLQKRRDQLAEKQFKIQKAVSIGQALINTYEMANRAYNAVLAGPEKFLGISSLVLAKIAAGTATALGLANVAAISRQQFVPSGLNIGGGAAGGGAGASIQAPDFNIVGASETSQLAEAVTGQQAKPIKAFVVGKDISTQQELDRNITTTASIG
jgi:hypothetical protein